MIVDDQEELQEQQQVVSQSGEHVSSSSHQKKAAIKKLGGGQTPRGVNFRASNSQFNRKQIESEKADAEVTKKVINSFMSPKSQTKESE